MFQFSSVQSLSRVQLFATPWIAACQTSQSITNSRSSPRLTSIVAVMPSSHLILCRPLLLLPPIPPSIRVFSNESTLHMRWPKYWSFSFSIIPSKGGVISLWNLSEDYSHIFFCFFYSARNTISWPFTRDCLQVCVSFSESSQIQQLQGSDSSLPPLKFKSL